jgi:hypothetical protein
MCSANVRRARRVILALGTRTLVREVTVDAEATLAAHSSVRCGRVPAMHSVARRPPEKRNEGDTSRRSCDETNAMQLSRVLIRARGRVPTMHSAIWPFGRRATSLPRKRKRGAQLQ